MKFSKFFAVVLSFAVFMGSAHAQDAGTLAATAFRQSNYSDAAQLYDAAASVESDTNKKNEYHEAAKKSRTCSALLSQAKSLYKTAQEAWTEDAYLAAKEKCQSLLKNNRYDALAQEILLDCEAQIATYAHIRLENETWDRVIKGGSKELYEAYLADFPEGTHVAEAEAMIKQIEEYDLWVQTDNEGTMEAYRHYLNTTKAGTYTSQAEAALGALIDDVIWDKTLAAGDEAAFREYIEDTDNKCKLHLQEAQAHLAVKMATKYASLPDAEPQEVIKELEKAKDLIPFDNQTALLYQVNKEKVDYQSFMASPTIETGKEFLATYPDGLHTDDVSNVVASLYLDSFDINTTSAEFAVAKSYATTSAMKRAVAAKEKDIRKKRAAAEKEQVLAAKEDINQKVAEENADYQSFMASPTIEAGKKFLATYPDGLHTDDVSNVVASLYLDSFDINTTSAEFAVAKSYATTSAMKRDVAAKEKEIRNQRAAAEQEKTLAEKDDSNRKSAERSTTVTSTPVPAPVPPPSKADVAKSSTRTRTPKNRVWLEVGVDYEWLESAAIYLPKVGFKFGAPSDFFNFYFGAKYMSMDSGNFGVADGTYPCLCYEAAPLYAGMKFGLIKIKSSGRIYLAVEGSYSYPLDAFIHYSDNTADMMYINDCISTDIWDVSGKLGVSAGWFDCGFYYKYLMTPMFNDDTVSFTGYDELAQQGVFGDFTSKYRLGVYFNIDLRLGKKK